MLCLHIPILSSIRIFSLIENLEKSLAHHVYVEKKNYNVAVTLY